MKPIHALHEPLPGVLEVVVAAMRGLGPPVVEVVDFGTHYAALEGSHRLAAAARLGLTPCLRIRTADEAIDPTTYDWFDDAFFPDLYYSAGVTAARLHWRPGPVYRFD